MSEEFNLSEKIREGYTPMCDFVHITDVREFIRLLKERIHHHGKGGMTVGTRFNIYKIIDFLAGSALVET